MKRIENISSGMADTVNINQAGTTFWMEVKCLYKWPAREKTCPLRNAFEPGQVPFLREWKCWNGHSFVLLKVDDSYFLLNPDDPLDEMTRIELINHAVSFDMESIISFLMNLGKYE
jgi:penicillin-binding protein-related factor A (putative recombinase)